MSYIFSASFGRGKDNLFFLNKERAPNMTAMQAINTNTFLAAFLKLRIWVYFLLGRGSEFRTSKSCFSLDSVAS